MNERLSSKPPLISKVEVQNKTNIRKDIYKRIDRNNTPIPETKPNSTNLKK